MLTHEKYLDALKRFAPSTSSPTFRTFLSELDEAGATQREGETEWLSALTQSADEERKLRAYDIQKACDAREKIRFRRRASDASRGVRIWSGKNADSADSGVAMERDFTVPGTPGQLGCPFAKRLEKSVSVNATSVNGVPKRGISTPRSSLSRTPSRRSKRHSFHDPIRAEICGADNHGSSTAASIEGSVPLCPIRFLDQHSPEEMAQYFEKHKHELPRSHEVCVKRYQSNEESIRRLDQKYGNLVSMIQGLGQRHQNMFPEKEDVAVEDEHAPEEEKGESKVGKWARTVSESMEVEAAVNGGEQADEHREPRFDRPLKEVRVGESPSRPWGIPVPTDYHKASSVASGKSDPTAAPLEPSPKEEKTTKAKCPFDHLVNSGLHPPSEQQAKPESEKADTIPKTPAVSREIEVKPDKPTQVVFNGPVFIGYPVEQALSFLQRSGFEKRP